MKPIKGTPLQALKFAVRLNNNTCALFLTKFMAGEDMSAWAIALGDMVDTARTTPARQTFVEFCLANPDEATFIGTDGTVRKTHYGSGRQPWDDMVEFGWAVDFAAACILKYLRRTKDPEDIDDAKWYFARLIEFTKDDNDTARSNDAMRVTGQLLRALTQDERDTLGLPSCFRPINP